MQAFSLKKNLIIKKFFAKSDGNDFKISKNSYLFNVNKVQNVLHNAL